ncbi:MAG: DHA2 family efflux MFS transporter permease subunit [Magnetococcales bacterium]|nr:DHA2 family efflux MFS transporter permease subunit [Magnetococcales bacterium]
MEKADTPAIAPPHPMLVAVVVSLAAFMEVLDTTITNVSLTHIAGSLAASQNESSWVLTSYLVANGIVLPLSGWLAGVMGRKNFFLLCITCFTVASFACGIATSLPVLIGFRLLQGLAGGGLQPMQQAIIMDSFPPEKRGVAFGITGITMVVAPILGPTLGGYITDHFSWRWIFFMNVPVGLLAVLLVKALVTDPPHARAKGLFSIDYIGMGLLALGLGAMQIVLDKGEEDDWFDSHFIILCTIVAAISLIAAFLWLWRQNEAIVDLRLLQDRYFGPACLMIFVVGFVLYGSSTLLPMLVQSQFGYDATLAGLVLSPGGLAVIVLMPTVGKLVNKIQSRYLIVVGMTLTGSGMAMTALFTPQTDYSTFVLMRILQVSGLPFLFVPISTMAFSAIPKEKSNKASALFSMMRNLGGSFGIAIILSYLLQRQQWHQTILGQHLATTDTAMQTTLATVTRTLIDHGYPPSSAPTQAMEVMHRHLMHHAVILGYGDAFQIFAVFIGTLAVAALFLPRNKIHEVKPPPPGMNDGRRKPNGNRQ